MAVSTDNTRAMINIYNEIAALTKQVTLKFVTPVVLVTKKLVNEEKNFLLANVISDDIKIVTTILKNSSQMKCFMNLSEKLEMMGIFIILRLVGCLVVE